MMELNWIYTCFCSGHCFFGLLLNLSEPKRKEHICFRWLERTSASVKDSGTQCLFKHCLVWLRKKIEEERTEIQHWCSLSLAFKSLEVVKGQSFCCFPHRLSESVLPERNAFKSILDVLFSRWGGQDFMYTTNCIFKKQSCAFLQGLKSY